MAIVYSERGGKRTYYPETERYTVEEAFVEYILLGADVGDGIRKHTSDVGYILNVDGKERVVYHLPHNETTFDRLMNRLGYEDVHVDVW